MGFIFASINGHRLPIYRKEYRTLTAEQHQKLANLQKQGYRLYYAATNPSSKKPAHYIQSIDTCSHALGKQFLAGNTEENLFARWKNNAEDYDYPGWLKQERFYEVKRPVFFPGKVSFWNYLNLPPIKEMRFLANQLFGNLLGKIILKAQTLDFSQEIKGKSAFIYTNQHYLNISQQKIFAPDGAELDTLELSSKTCDQHSQKEKKQPVYIVNFIGYDMCYEQILDDMKRDVADFETEGLNAHVIGFNYRNVAESRGKVRSKDDLVRDGITQVQRLLNQGVKPENIKLKAYSLGGGIGTLVADHFHQHGIPVYLFNNRSFSRLSTTVSGWIRTGKRNSYLDKNFFTKIAGIITRPFIRFGLIMANWEINAAAAYNRIPAEYKTFIVARSNKQQRDTLYERHNTDAGQRTSHFRIKDDSTISFRASLFNKVKSTYPSNKRKKSKMSLAYNSDVDSDEYAKNAHTASMLDIKNKKGVSAHSFFHRFVGKVYSKNPELLNEPLPFLQPVIRRTPLR